MIEKKYRSDDRTDDEHIRPPGQALKQVIIY